MAIGAGALAAAVLAGVVLLTVHLRSTPSSGPTPRPGTGSSRVVSPFGPPVYVHYYLWWTPGHWRNTLGPAYPLAAAVAAPVTPPLPGAVAPNGCGTGASFP